LSAEAAFKQFVADCASRALLFVGRAGDGKTVLLSRLYRQSGEAGALGVWYQAAE
jgi:hypothetical protein